MGASVEIPKRYVGKVAILYCRGKKASQGKEAEFLTVEYVN